MDQDPSGAERSDCAKDSYHFIYKPKQIQHFYMNFARPKSDIIVLRAKTIRNIYNNQPQKSR